MMLAAAAQKACENRKHITDYAASCETRNKLVLLSRYAYGGRGCALTFYGKDVPYIYYRFASLRPYSSCQHSDAVV